MRTLMGNLDDSLKARYQHDKYKAQKIHGIVPGSWLQWCWLVVQISTAADAVFEANYIPREFHSVLPPLSLQAFNAYEVFTSYFDINVIYHQRLFEIIRLNSDFTSQKMKTSKQI